MTAPKTPIDYSVPLVEMQRLLRAIEEAGARHQWKQMILATGALLYQVRRLIAWLNANVKERK